MIEKAIAFEILPHQVRALMKVSDRVYSQLVNTPNDADCLRKGFYQDDGYSHGPDLRRLPRDPDPVEEEEKPNIWDEDPNPEETRCRVWGFVIDSLREREAILL